MQNIFAGDSAWQLVAGADATSKAILFLLMLASFLCVTIIVAKLLYFARERRAARNAAKQASRAQVLGDLEGIAKQKTLAGSLVTQGLAHARALEGASRLSDNQARLEGQLDGVVDQLLHEAESGLPALGIAGAVSPLVGLFGTVWGLIHAFMNIAHEQSADITVVAPGIAEALLTTLAGLVVAIPAMIFFHYFSNELRKVEHSLVIISDRIALLGGN